MQKKAAETEVSQARLVDLMCLCIAFDAYIAAQEGDEEDEEGEGLDALGKKGLILVRRYQIALNDGITKYLLPLQDRKDTATLKIAFREMQRSGTPIQIVKWQARAISLILPWMRSRPIFRTVFPSKAGTAARELARATIEEIPATQLQLIAAIVPVSGLSVPHKWIEAAAAAAGAPLSVMASVAADAGAAQGMAEEIRKLSIQLEAVNDPKKKLALTAERDSLRTKILAVARASENTATVLASAVSVIHEQGGHATAHGRKLGLNAQQEGAMVAEGRKVIAAGAGSGKCVVGHTLVQTEAGFLPIGELGQGLDDEEDSPLELLVHGEKGPEKTSHIYFDGFRATRKIETSQGYELEGTGPHKILCLRAGKTEWVKLEDLSEGDVVCIDRRPGLFAEQPFKRIPDGPEKFSTSARNSSTRIPVELTPQVASLLGWIVSEGYVRSNAWNISLSTTDEQQRDLYYKAMSGLVTPVESEDNRFKKQFVLGLHRSRDIQALMGFGLTRTLAADKEIPAGVLQSPKPVVRAFLQSLFDGDGGVTANKVEFCTASTVLAQQVHVLLAAFGIPSRRRFRPNARQGAWHITLSGLGLRTFAREIGFNLTSKKERLETLVQRDTNTNIDVIPGLQDLCRTVKEQYASSHGSKRTMDAGYGTYKCLIAGTRRPSLDTLGAFLEFYPVPDSEEWKSLEALTKQGWFYDTILEITEHTAPVYDFVVPGTHSFSAGGFINHNTRVLAGEVAYRINELGVPAESICAVSFTRKSSQELTSRVREYGAVISGAGDKGFGTTHSLAGLLILNQYGQAQRRPKYAGAEDQWKVTTLIALAVKQVSFDGGSPHDAPPPTNFFTGKETPVPQEVKNTPVPSFEDTEDTEAKEAFLEALNQTGRYFRKELDAAPQWKTKYVEWLTRSMNFLGDTYDKVEGGKHPSDFSLSQKSYLNDLFARTGNVSYRVASLMNLTAASQEEEDEGEEEGGGVKRQGLKKYHAFNNPLGQWFNLGVSWTGSGDQKGEDGQKFSAPAVRRKISIWKGMGASPEETWWAAGPCEGEQPYTPEAAAYAAYEYLKGSRGEPDFRNTGDMDDLLHDAIRTMIQSKKARSTLQSRFKVVMVDESQDLNASQHLLFGLLAGYLDSQTLKPNADGSMTADVFSLVGDDKQAIYAFRGADPDQFIEKSDLTEEGEGGFDTYLLDTNYRSGQAIVTAANNLIAHNSKQIPMVCKANYEVKGDGRIRAVTHEDNMAAALSVSEEIADSVEAFSTDLKRYSNFGIAVRSNAEADFYALGMMTRAIPFRTKLDPFRHKHMKAMLGWMSLVEQGRKGNPDIIKEALSGAVLLPTSFMGKAFTSRIKEQDDPLGWLLNGEVYKSVGASYAKRVEAFIENVQICLRHHGSPDTPSEIYRDLMNTLRGMGGKSFFDSVVEGIKDNNATMADIAAENPDGIPTIEQIMEAAEDELLILTGLMEAKPSVKEIMEYTRELKRVNEKTRVDNEGTQDAVTIATMHSWKGLECPKMFIPMVRGKFPRGVLEKDENGNIVCKPPTDQKELASERRLAYVAITRAESDCVILDIPNPKLSCPPSQFLEEACVKFDGREPVMDVGDEGTTRQALEKKWGSSILAREWSDEEIEELARMAPEDDLLDL